MTKKLWLTKEARGSQYTETRRYISGFELIINTIVLCSQERCPSQRGFCYYGQYHHKIAVRYGVFMTSIADRQSLFPEGNKLFKV